MGASDILNNSNTNLDDARYERNNRLNPPEFAPMQSDTSGLDDIFDDSYLDSAYSGGFSDTGVSGAPSTMPVGGFNPAQYTMSQQGGVSNANQTSTEDKVFELIAKFFKSLLNFGKDFINSFSQVTPKFWSKYGSHTFIAGLVLTVIGLVLKLFGVSIGTSIMVGSLLSSATGVLVLMFTVDKAKGYTSMFKDDTTAQSQPQNSFTPVSDMDYGDPFMDDDDPYQSGGYEDPFADEDPYDIGGTSDSPEEYDDLLDILDDVSSLNTPTQESGSANMSFDEALETMPQIDKGMYTRQYLYDNFVKVLEGYNPDYADIKKIDEDSDVFIQWEQYLRDASETVGVKSDNLPDLISLEENLFTIKLTTTRPVGFKHDVVATELANIFAYAGGSLNSKVYATAEAVGKNCIFTIFTGETAMISLRDMYKNCKDFILDSDNTIPVVLGVDQQGQVIKCDFRKVESVLVAGMPRSGKSWFVQAVLTQMCALVSPRQLSLYVCDPKEGISDYKAFCLPHVKKFVNNDNDIVTTLRALVKQEAPRRKKLIGDAGFVNIWDYKERHPDVHLPVIYVVIDEVVTLAERMDKETKQEFQGLLVELISQLPALGIRAFLIPHVIKNDIIRKTTTDLIPCRISVCGDAEHVESTTGTKPKDFTYKLKNTGDMAVKIPVVSSKTMFVHAPVLSNSNPKNNDIFDYLRRMWKVLEPDESGTEVTKKAEEDKLNEELLRSLETDDLDDILFD